MRKLLATVVLLALAAPAWAQDPGRRTVHDFHLAAPVEYQEPLVAGEAYAVGLSAEASATLRETPEVRLFDAFQREVPSIVATEHARTETIKRPVRILNQVWEPGLIQRFTVELTDRNPQAVNTFVLDIAEPAYNAQVVIEAGNDLHDWMVVREGLHLIRHTLPGEDVKFVHNTLTIPTSRYRYYRFTIAASGRTRPLPITEVAVLQRVSRGRALSLAVTPKPWDNPDDPDERHAYYLLTLPEDRLGIDRLRLTIEGTEYERRAELREWNEALNRPKQYVLARGILFHYGDDVQTTLSGFTADAKTLVLMIDHGDDEPMPVIGATASRPQQEVRFLMEDSFTGPLQLYFKPEQARAPKYDLPRRLAERKIVDFAALSHGPLQPNPAYEPPAPPISERIPYLIYAVVILLGIILAVYIARTVRAGLPPDSPDGGG